MRDLYIEQYGYAAWRDVEDLFELMEVMSDSDVVEDINLY